VIANDLHQTVGLASDTDTDTWLPVLSFVLERSCPAARLTASPVTGDRPPPLRGNTLPTQGQTGRRSEEARIGMDGDGGGSGADA
jgi:hypothetical protein